MGLAAARLNEHASLLALSVGVEAPEGLLVGQVVGRVVNRAP